MKYFGRIKNCFINGRIRIICNHLFTFFIHLIQSLAFANDFNNYIFPPSCYTNNIRSVSANQASRFECTIKINMRISSYLSSHSASEKF